MDNNTSLAQSNSNIVNVKLIINDNFALHKFKILVGKKQDEANSILGASMEHPQLIAKINYSKSSDSDGKVFSEYTCDKLIIVGKDINFEEASTLLGF